jgi:exopolysaccharide biosynthesis polyprenyl glycosylphosphotransferase
VTDIAVAGGLAKPARKTTPETTEPFEQLDRRDAVWVLPDKIPAIVPQTARHTEQRWVRAYRWAAIGSDLCACLFGVAVALLFRFGNQVSGEYLILGAAIPFGWLISVWLCKGYESRFFGSGAEEFRSILRGGAGLTAAIAITSYATHSSVARGFVVLAMPTTVLLALALRWLQRRDLARRRDSGQCMRRVLVVGRNAQAATLAGHLGYLPSDGYVVVATCLPRGDRDPEAPVDLAEADIMAAVDAHSVDVVAVAADPELAGQSLRRLSWALEQQGVELVVSPGIVEVAGPRISVRPVAGLSLLHLERPSVSGGPHLLKSVFDRVSALILILLLLPLMLAIALAVRFTSRGPVLFRQHRVGRAGEEFTMLKFRSMCADAEDRRDAMRALSDGNAVLFKMRSDPRVTRLGRTLRRYSLDELPQLFNVLRGEMSIVGPRPHLPEEVADYAADDSRRMLVKPGITGLWQVSGRSDLSWEETIRLDLRYVDNWSMTLDLLILGKTARAVLGQDGAY